MKRRLTRIFKNHGYWRTEWLAAFSVLGIVAVFAIAIPLGTTIGRHYSKRACNHYATATHRDTTFRSYTFWSWDCLTPTPGDEQHLIPIDKLAGTSR